MQLQISTLVAVISALSTLAHPILEQGESHQHHRHQHHQSKAVEVKSTEHDLSSAGPYSLELAGEPRIAKRSNNNQLKCTWCGRTGFATQTDLDNHEFTCGIGRKKGKKGAAPRKGKKGKRSEDLERRDESLVQEKRSGWCNCPECAGLD